MKNCFIKKLFLLFVVLHMSLFAVAQSNQYLHFDGQNDYVALPNASAPLNNSNTITMAGWFYTDALVYGQGMMSIRGGGSGSGEMYVIQLSDGKLECRVVTTTGLKEYASPNNTIQAGTWQHIAWVFNVNTVQLYINGTLVGSSAASGTFQAADKPFTIGRSIISDMSFYFGGRADEVSLWSKALTASEIQNMINSELAGNETGLVAYYKCNQGIPGADNTSITHLVCEGNPARNATLYNFALTGNTSNFAGVLEPGFQAISFPTIPNKLISAAPFQLNAIASSGLPVTYAIVSGPATVSGNTVTLTGTAGQVTVKASQAGNGTYDPASDQYAIFNVIDPAAVLPNTVIAHPLAGNVYAPSLMPVQIALHTGIDYPELLSVQSVTASIGGNNVPLRHHGNGYYTGWWTPAAYGNHTLTVVATNNHSASKTETTSFNLSQNASNVTDTGVFRAWVNVNVATVEVEADLPSYIGAYDQIMGKLIIECPSGGCDPWDRVSSIEVQGKNGEWYEIVRYLTPYGVACNRHVIDLTDFSSLLLGKTKFRVNLGTQGNGFLYTLNLEYRAGTPANPYTAVEKLWYNTYQFGDPANLQPAEVLNKEVPHNTRAAKIKLVATGHGWGNNNTGNAAEFQRNKHHIWVNNAQTFEHDNWNICNPNPDGCSPQSGTWQYNRAGWCPGSIAQFFDYNMTPYISQSSVNLKYILDEGYVDQCHPNNPNCISGTTCPDCNDGFNPHLITSSYFITYSNTPITLGIKAPETAAAQFSLYPNPSTGKFRVDFNTPMNAADIVVYDIAGKTVKHIPVAKGNTSVNVDLTGVKAGIYVLSVVEDGKPAATKRVVIE